jgi:succinoglycan biosynthesis protein ExoM
MTRTDPTPPAVEATARPHISVCICTYKRPQLLAQLLGALDVQRTEDRFTYSVVVADNDHGESARPVVGEFAGRASITVSYCVEPRQNIALARNRAVDNASGDFIAFIDDDEEPVADWLLHLHGTVIAYGADGAIGPGVARFVAPPPAWVVRGGFFERPSRPTGAWLHWRETRTGNTLLRRRIFAEQGYRFRAEYGRGGEDSDLFRRLIADGMRIVSCADAKVYRIILPERCRRAYLLKQALGRGYAPYNREPWPVLVSMLAVPVYAVALPASLFCGQHVFMRYLIKECDHLGRLLALVSAPKRAAVAAGHEAQPSDARSIP